MDIKDSNIKSQQTGGLKLMTVFIAVLALHVVVIGGFTVYHLMSGGSTDTDLTTTDKAHKGLNGSAVTDGTQSDATQPDKSTAATPADVASTSAATTASTTTPPTPMPDVTSSPATTPPPSAPDASAASNSTSTPASAPAPTPASSPAPAPILAPAATLTLATPTPAAAPTPSPAPMAGIANPGYQAPSGPIAPNLVPPPDSAPIAAPTLALVPTPAPTMAAGPVHMPPAEKSAEVPHEHMKVYIVKITDSYKKIALKHHVTVAQLKEANHITGNVLHTGQKLYIPSEKGEVAEKSQVAEKASTSTLSATPVLSESAAPMTTGLTSTSTTVASTGLHHHLYTVVKGDTLTKIAHRYKTTPSAIMAENGITDPTKLSIGKKLRIPSSSSSEETRSARALPVTPQPSQVQAKTSAPTAQLANYGN